MQVTIYSTTTCPYCKMLKDYLEEKKVSYTEKLVDQDDQAREEMTQKSGGFLGVPYVVISKAVGTEEVKEETVIGFDKEKLNQLLGIN
ncbi:hypothetical protein A2Z22_04865 [Candidatus Woesebacteria bacterium RBG_16_34_12]|uniref:Glutaredoxin domain-containing protein n=1 Tax=Candidatus Woesebacteria bacterium RBG_16_34_12 TaxID=1802480 RepID=A0A1F7XAE3_9BACT|nr:MAG: hypothetical protein A2Z22_04865 [Candidatus Woesebacteria bacterium RBG_16_34_12]